MRRLNVKLALWLVGITVFSMVGVHFLHGYQLDRNADFLKVQAEQARTAGNVQEAIKKYNQYLRHRDDREGYQALAELVVDVAEQADATNRDKLRAYNILEEAIRRHSDLDDVRASLIDYSMLVRRFPDAQEHIKFLLERGKDDPELEYKSAVCFFATGDEDLARKKLATMVGFDDVTKAFVEEPPATAKEVQAFSLLARILRNRNDDEQADAVMQQLVKWNPDSAEAHLARGRYLRELLRTTVDGDMANSKESTDKLFAGIKAEFESAFQLAPDDADTLLEVATTAIMEKDFAKAEGLLDRARNEHPDRQVVYVRLAELAIAQGNIDQANKHLREGLEKAKDTRQILEQLIDIQFQLPDLAAARQTYERMRKIDSIPREYIRYQEARLKLAEGKIVEAIREFEQVRPAMERLGTRELQRVNIFLANCYEKLGLPDQQLEVYRRLLDSYPSLLIARLGEATALQNLGRHAEAEKSVAMLAGAAEFFPTVQLAILRLAANQQLSKPEAERNWGPTEKVAAMLFQDATRTPKQNQMLKVELLLAQGQGDEALETLTALRKEDPKDVSVWVAISKLLARDENNREKIPQFLTLAEKQVGDVAPLRSERIQAAANKADGISLDDVKKLEEGIDKFSDVEQRTLFQQLAQAYLRAGSIDDGMRCWNAAMAKDPSNSRLRQLVFELAMRRQDDEAMQAILKELRGSSYFGPESPLYKYCDASRTLQNFAGRKRENNKLSEADRGLLADVRKQVDEAIAVRQEWAPLWHVRGEIDRLEGNIDGAIINYQRSLNYSRFNQEMTARGLVTLLYAVRRYTEANEALKYLSGAQLPEPLQQLIQDTKLKSGETSAAVEMARKEVEEHPEDPMKHLWYGQVLNTAGQSDEAEQAFRKATEVGPELPAAWDLLVRRLLLSRKKNEAVAAVREASKTLSEDSLSMATLYQLVDDVQQADQLYQAALAEKPDDLDVLKRVIEFEYAANLPEKATEHLDQLIQNGLKSPEKNAIEYVRWARRRKAQDLVGVGDYQNTIAAVELIKQNAPDGKLDRLDLLSIVRLLGDRPEHESRAEAIRLLEELHETQGLSALQMSALGKLYEREGKWTKAKDMMIGAINSRSNDPAVFSLFAKMLLDHGDVEEASRHAGRAEELLAKSSTPVADATKHEIHTVRARLLIQDGKKEDAARIIEGMLARPLPQGQLVRLGFLSMELERLGLYEAAERLLDEYLSQEQRAAIAMAAFQGRRGNVDEAFTLLEEARKNQPIIEILPVALEILRNYPKSATNERCQLLEQWAIGAVETEGNPQNIKLVLAELYDLQGRYDDVTKIYRDLLADPKTLPQIKARVQNNLAFVLTAVKPSPQRAAEALQLVNDAIRVLGPTADLLDTRAVAYLAQGKLKQAAQDMRVAVIDNPSIAKYYHQAQIEKQLGNLDAARVAITKAQELQGDHNPFTPVERQGFEKLQQELN